MCCAILERREFVIREIDSIFCRSRTVKVASETQHACHLKELWVRTFGWNGSPCISNRHNIPLNSLLAEYWIQKNLWKQISYEKLKCYLGKIHSKIYDVQECATRGVYWVNLWFKDGNSIDASVHTYLYIYGMYNNMYISWWVYFVIGLSLVLHITLDCRTSQNSQESTHII